MRHRRRKIIKKYFIVYFITGLKTVTGNQIELFQVLNNDLMNPSLEIREKAFCLILQKLCQDHQNEDPLCYQEVSVDCLR